MMLIEIWLTVLAWRKGWNGYALLPMLVSFSLAFLTGFVVTLGGGSVDRIMPVAILFDICSIVSLTMMATRQPNAARTVQAVEDKAVPAESQPQLETLPAPQLGS